MLQFSMRIVTFNDLEPYWTSHGFGFKEIQMIAGF